MITPADVSTIRPNTSIYLLKGVQCEMAEDTLYFSSKTAQYNYFYSKRDKSLSWEQNTPVSIQLGELLVKANADKVIECNYLMIRNSNFSTRWWYCIITKVTWLSPNSSKVEFIVDAVQTYFFDYKVDTAFIIREHVSNDTVGTHTIPEGLELGEYVLDKISAIGGEWLSSYYIAVYSTYGSTTQPIRGQIDDGMYTGVAPQLFTGDTEGANKASDFLESLTEDNKADSVVCILWIPKIFNTGGDIETTVSRPTRIDGYLPKNNKLFTYPYVGAVLSNNQGVNAPLRFEYSSVAPNLKFHTEAKMSGNPSVITVPINYRGEAFDLSSKVILSNFPMCAYGIDSYKAWQAMNGGAIPANLSMAGGVLGGSVSGATTGASIGGAIGSVVPVAGTAIGATAGAVIGGIGGALSSLGKVEATTNMPIQAYGTGGGNILFQLSNDENLKKLGSICVYVNTIRKEYAKAIDDFFTMYGYKVNRIGVPSRNNRENFTYCQCAEVKLSGNVPQVYQEQIISRYKQGIRFWNNTSTYKNIQVSNLPREGE